MPLTSAALDFRGFPKEIDLPKPRRPGLRLQSREPDRSYQRERGSYTRYGDVTPLVKSIDNRFVVFGSGEEIAAEFDTATLPAPPPHWKRDYFFYANGYEKDMDWWDASPYTVAQMPFHEMSSYPYPASEKFPDDASSLAYQLDGTIASIQAMLCTRIVSTSSCGPPRRKTICRRCRRAHTMNEIVLRPAAEQLEFWQRPDFQWPNWPKLISANRAAQSTTQRSRRL